MRKTIFAVVVLGLALVVQLAVLNGLRLPGSAVPDLVLVLVAVLAMTDGPVRGMVTGFAAGLCMDLAPPGSALLGEYALVFCLVGCAAGKLNVLVTRSALLCVAIVAVIVALGEALVAGLGLALDPAQTSWAEVRQVLPYSVGYDLLALPFALWLAMALRAWDARAVAKHTAGGVLAGAGAGHGARKKYRPREPRLAEGFARPHDGWVGSRPAGVAGAGRAAGRAAALRRPAVPHGLRPANGVAGSAASWPPLRAGVAVPAVHLRLASKRRRDGAVASTVGSSLGRHPSPHPGLRSSGGRGFRPHAGVRGGSAAMQSVALVQPGWRRPVTVSFSARRGDASVGRLLGSSLGSLVAPRSRKRASPRFRGTSSGTSPGLAAGLNAGRMPDQHAIMAARRRYTATPRLRLGSSLGSLVAPRSRKRASPRFRGTSSGTSPGLAAGLNAGRMPDQHAIMAARRRYTATPRLRLASSRRGDRVVGGSVLGRSVHGLRRSVRPATPRFRSRPLAHSSGRTRKQPQFGYGRHSVLSFLAGRRIGGKWLASARVGTRSGVWLIGKRTGVPR